MLEGSPREARFVELADSGLSVAAYLQNEINERHAVEIDWVALCREGVALLLFDGLDELPLHLRTKTLECISEFSARFPRTPWMMTARDMVGTVAPAGARILELQRLKLDDVETFCRGWLPKERHAVATKIAAAVAISRELQRMARVPFLLALMTEHARANDAPAPTRRAEREQEPTLMSSVDAQYSREAQIFPTPPRLALQADLKLQVTARCQRVLPPLEQSLHPGLHGAGRPPKTEHAR